MKTISLSKVESHHVVGLPRGAVFTYADEDHKVRHTLDKNNERGMIVVVLNRDQNFLPGGRTACQNADGRRMIVESVNVDIIKTPADLALEFLVNCR